MVCKSANQKAVFLNLRRYILAKYRPGAQILAVCVEDPHDPTHSAGSVVGLCTLNHVDP
jgi:hypothetical protein